MSYVFVSYSHKDKEYAHRLEKALRRRGFEVWLDDRIDYGSEWPEEIERRLNGCKAMILIMTAHSKNSRWVRREVAWSDENRKKIFPLLLQGDGRWLSVGDIQHVDVRGGKLPPKAFYDTLARVLPRKDIRPSQQIQVKPPSEPTPDEQQPKDGDVVANSIGMQLVYIPPGSFMMGSGDSAAQLAKIYDTYEDFSDEFPQHKVRISQGFRMGQTVVTQGQYESVMNARPWSGEKHVQEDANNPANYVSLRDAVKFCRKLSRQEDRTYRLPTEGEWEYVCRAGTTTRYSFGDDHASLGYYAWFTGNCSKVDEDHVHEVGQKKPNPWGLYDMHGNVSEWCSDRYRKGYYSNSPSVDPNGPSLSIDRCMRGGSWNDLEFNLRCSARDFFMTGNWASSIGFRVVRSQP